MVSNMGLKKFEEIGQVGQMSSIRKLYCWAIGGKILHHHPQVVMWKTNNQLITQNVKDVLKDEHSKLQNEKDFVISKMWNWWLKL